MATCKLSRCPIKDNQYMKDHCFYGYTDPQCWRGWVDKIWFVIRFRFSKEYRGIGK